VAMAVTQLPWPLSVARRINDSLDMRIFLFVGEFLCGRGDEG
jgi:hypothetical protein